MNKVQTVSKPNLRAIAVAAKKAFDKVKAEAELTKAEAEVEVKVEAEAEAEAEAKAPSPAKAPSTSIELARANVKSKAGEGVGVTLHTNGNAIKGLSAEPVVARPQRKMLRVIDKIIGHPGKGNCIKRFHLYSEGMTLLHAKVTEGLIPSDVTFYAELGYLTLREPTDDEYNASVKAWEAQSVTKVEAEAKAA